MAVLRLCVLAEGLPAGDDPVGGVVTGLATRHEVVLALTDRRPAGEGRLGGARVVAVDGAGDGFDAAIATTWPTTAHLFGVAAERYVELVRTLEFEAMAGWQAERLAAQLALDLPVDFVADPSAADALRALRPDARVVVARLPLVPAGDSIEVVLEGSPVPAMLAGAVAVVLPANAGPVEHMVSGVVAEPEDEADVARWVEQLRRDEPLRSRLAEGARAAVAGWPSDVREVEAALEEIVRTAPPPAARWPHRLMGDVMAGVALLRQDHFVAAAHIERLESDEAFNVARRVRERAERSAALRAVVRGAKKRLR